MYTHRALDLEAVQNASEKGSLEVWNLTTLIMQASSPAMQKNYEICREKKVHNDTLNITTFVSVPKPKPKPQHNLNKCSHTLHRRHSLHTRLLTPSS
jgi:hypothetical protein